MENLNITSLWAIGVFIVVFFVNYIFIYKRSYKKVSDKKIRKRTKGIENLLGFSYLVPKFNLDVNKMNLKSVFLMLSLINAFIISIVFIIIYIVNWDIEFKLLLGFVLLFLLIYALYDIFGRMLVKKGWVKDEYKKN